MKYNIVLFVIIFVFLFTAFPVLGFDENSSIKEIDSFLVGNTATILGSNSSVVEHEIYDTFIDKKTAKYNTFLNDTELQNISNFNSYILFGDETKNMVTNILIKNSTLIKKNEYYFGYIEFREADKIRCVVISSLNKEKINYNNSLLKDIIPDKYIPITASALTIVLALLWNLLSPLLFKIIKGKTGSLIFKKLKKSKEIKKSGKNIFGIYLKRREWLTILFTAILFAVSDSYMKIFHLSAGVILIFVASFANIIVYSIRNLIRLILDKIYNLHSEYMFWTPGLILTLISGALGSTFYLAGYVEYKDKNSFPIIPYLTNLATFVLFLVFFFFQFSNGLLYEKLMYMFLILSLLQILPIKPYSGKVIYEWNKIAWWLMFIIIFVFYVMISII